MLLRTTIGLELLLSSMNWTVSYFRITLDSANAMVGRNAWKEDPISPAYDHKLLCKRLRQLREARTAGDVSRVLFLLRTSLTRNFAHTGNPEVY
jgi:TAG lipase / steryl ester hydrolase / phospholipase A2 / LPA acyltransferase